MASLLQPAIDAGLVRSREQKRTDYINKYFSAFADNDELLRQAGYGDLVGANYWNKLQYKPGILDGIISQLGGRTGEDKFWENAAMQYGEFQSGLMEQMHQEQYDSETAKVQRMRQAGENPDLLGTGDVADSPGLGDDTNNVLPSNEDIASAVGSIGERIMSLIPTAMGFVTNLKELKALGVSIIGQELSNEGQQKINEGIEADNATKRTNLFSSILEGTKTGLMASVPASPTASVAGSLGETVKEPSLADQRVMARDRFIGLVDKADLPESVKRDMRESAKVLYDSVDFDTDLPAKRSERITNRINYSRLKQSKFYDGISGDMDFTLDLLNKWMAEINDATQEFYLLRQRYEFSNAAAYAKRSGELGNPMIQAEQEGLQLPLQTASISIDNAYKKLMAKINDAEKGLESDLREAANNGGFWNKALYYSLMGLKIAGAGIGVVPGKSGGLSYGLGF